MNLDRMTLAEFEGMLSALADIAAAAGLLDNLPRTAEGETEIHCRPGGAVVITTHFRMPDCCGYDCAAPAVLVEDVPGAMPLAEGMPGGVGDLQQHSPVEHPPGQVEPIQTAETGASPEPAPAGDPVAVAPAVAATGTVEGGGMPDSAPVTPKRPAPAPAGAITGAVWTPDEEARLIACVAAAIHRGMGRTAAMEQGAAELGRPVAGTIFRLRNKLRAQLDAAIAALRDDDIPAGQPAEAGGAGPVPAEGAGPDAREPAGTQSPPDTGPARAAAPVAGGAAPIIPARQREIAAALARVPSRRGFDAELDLEIVEGFSLGAKASQLALDLDLDSKDMLERFRDLTACIRNDRGQMSFEDQGHLVAVLRRRLAEARGAAA